MITQANTNKWWKIETAKTDGSPMMVGVKRNNRIIKSKANKVWFQNNRWRASYEAVGEFADCLLPFTPTHWMPLPEPPTESAA